MKKKVFLPRNKVVNEGGDLFEENKTVDWVGK